MAGVEGEQQVAGIDVDIQFGQDGDDLAVRGVVEIQIMFAVVGIVVACSDVGEVVVVGGETIPTSNVGVLGSAVQTALKILCIRKLGDGTAVGAEGGGYRRVRVRIAAVGHHVELVVRVGGQSVEGVGGVGGLNFGERIGAARGAVVERPGGSATHLVPAQRGTIRGDVGGGQTVRLCTRDAAQADVIDGGGEMVVAV